MLLGEGNFTFSVAIASMRGSWKGITATHFLVHPQPQIATVQLEAISFCIRNGESMSSEASMIVERIHKIASLPLPDQGVLQLGVDTTNLPNDLEVKNKIVWFQCPSSDLEHETDKLIQAFVQHMSTKQTSGDYLLIGITKFFPFVKNYKLHTLLGDKLTGPAFGYKFIGADKTLIEDILKFGYHHCTCSGLDIHFTIFSHHITLIFQKN